VTICNPRSAETLAPPTASSSLAKCGPHLAFEHIEDIAGSDQDIGYEQDGFHWKHAKVEVLLHEQSADIAQA